MEFENVTKEAAVKQLRQGTAELKPVPASRCKSKKYIEKVRHRYPGVRKLAIINKRFYVLLYVIFFFR